MRAGKLIKRRLRVLTHTAAKFWYKPRHLTAVARVRARHRTLQLVPLSKADTAERRKRLHGTERVIQTFPTFSDPDINFLAHSRIHIRCTIDWHFGRPPHMVPIAVGSCRLGVVKRRGGGPTRYGHSRTVCLRSPGAPLGARRARSGPVRGGDINWFFN
eukprot:SAG11_NODE_619_length_8173_cov_4.837255_1_plen_159_part_00